MDENTFMGPKVNKAEIEKISQMVDLSLQQGGKDSIRYDTGEKTNRKW